jgi:alkyl hydroperoxide reductase subunit F
MYDLAIIGGGPAGVAAAVYASRKHLKTVILTYAVKNQLNYGGQSVVSEDIQNWIGTVSVSGQELAKMLENHLKAYAEGFVDIKENAKVAQLEPGEGKSFKITTEKGESFESRTVLITTGSVRRKLSIPGAEQYENKGITYCASCDGPLFSGKDVAVIGGGNAGFETAAQLLAYAKSVVLFEYGPEFKADPVTVKKVLANPIMSAHNNVELQEVKGDQFVKALVYKDMQSGSLHEAEVQGIFVEIGLIPATSFLEGTVELNKYKQVVIDPKTQRASLEGIWAAGDCTDGLYHQNNIAVGDAVRALEDIYLFLNAR